MGSCGGTIGIIWGSYIGRIRLIWMIVKNPLQGIHEAVNEIILSKLRSHISKSYVLHGKRRVAEAMRKPGGARSNISRLACKAAGWRRVAEAWRKVLLFGMAGVEWRKQSVSNNDKKAASRYVLKWRA